MKNTKQMLGSRIRELRKGKGLSQDQLSEQIGVDPKHLSRIEIGKSFPYMETLDSLAKALGVELKDLFDFAHLDDGLIEIEQIGKLLEGQGQDKLRLIYKMVRALLK